MIFRGNVYSKTKWVGLGMRLTDKYIHIHTLTFDPGCSLALRCSAITYFFLYILDMLKLLVDN